MSKTIVILGGRGVMGRVTGHLLTRAGHRVVNLGSRDWDRAPSELAAADVCIVSVPIGDTPAIIRRAARHLRRECILADVTSVKEEPLAVMLEAHPGPVLALHPMFGEGSETFRGHTVIACGGRDPEATAWIVDLIRADGARVLELDAARHDAIMSYIQALRFFIMFAWGAFLREEGVDHARVTDLSSPVNRITMYELGRFFFKAGPLYPQIMALDPRRRDTIRRFADMVARHARTVEAGDTAALAAAMDDVREWFGDFCAVGQVRTDHIIAAMLRDEAPFSVAALDENRARLLPRATGDRMLAEGRWLRFMEREWLDRDGGRRVWEYAARRGTAGAVVVIPWLMPEERLVFIRQHRVPLDCDVIEFPAGLLDDGEDAAACALRELREETGYVGMMRHMTPPSYSSPGLCDEHVCQALVHIDITLAENRAPRPAPEAGECITVHTATRGEIPAFLAAMQRKGCRLDSKVVSYCLGMGIMVGQEGT